MLERLNEIFHTPRSAVFVALVAVLVFNAGFVPGGGYQTGSGSEYYLSAGDPLLEAFSALRQESPVRFEIGLRAQLHIYTLVRFVREVAPMVIAGEENYGFLARLYMFSARLFSDVNHRGADPTLIQEALDVMGVALRERLETERQSPVENGFESAALPILEALAAAADATEATVVLREALQTEEEQEIPLLAVEPEETTIEAETAAETNTVPVSSTTVENQDVVEPAVVKAEAVKEEQTTDALSVENVDEDLSLPGDEMQSMTAPEEKPAPHVEVAPRISRDAWAGLYQNEKQADQIIDSLEMKLDFLH